MEKAKVKFCIQTDFGIVNITTSEGVVESPVNFYKVKIAIIFVLEYGFISSNVTIKEEKAGEFQQTAVITSKIEACDCPANADSNTDYCYETDTSNAKTYNQNDILGVCVYNRNGNTIITSFKDVELHNVQISTQVIDPDGIPTALASVSKLNEDIAIVNTRIISAFFIPLMEHNRPSSMLRVPVSLDSRLRVLVNLQALVLKEQGKCAICRMKKQEVKGPLMLKYCCRMMRRWMGLQVSMCWNMKSCHFL